MINRFYRLTPYFRLDHNPLFSLEARRVRWGVTAELMLRAARGG